MGAEHSSLETIGEQLQVLAEHCDEAPEQFELSLLQRLWERARSQRSEVADRLLARIAPRLKRLQSQQCVAAKADINTSEPATPSPLHGLLELLEPEWQAPEKASIGLAFDEYLLQQESEVLRAWSGEQLERAESELLSNSGRVGLKSARRYQELRLKRYADSLLTQAIAEAPEDPGPLNPQMLAIKSLRNMRDLSPHYLNRFVSYVDSMLYLELLVDVAEDSKSKKGKAVRKGRKKSG